MDYSHRVKQANDYDYSDEPMQAIIDRQRDIIELQAREIVRLQEHARELESKLEIVNLPLYAPDKTGHSAWTGTAQSW